MVLALGGERQVWCASNLFFLVIPIYQIPMLPLLPPFYKYAITATIMSPVHATIYKRVYMYGRPEV